MDGPVALTELERIFLPKSSALLSDRLRELILHGRIAVGEMLPPERTLVTQTGLSRSSVREALRILEAEGLIETVRGRNGGTRVVMPGRANLSRSVEIFMRGSGVPPSALLECRAAIEPMLARLAALHRTEEELAQMEDVQQKFARAQADLPLFRTLNYDWHRQIAHCSRNEPLIALMDAIFTISLDTAEFSRVSVPESRVAAVVSHAAVMACIRTRDGDGAAAAMEGHLLGLAGIARRVNA